MWDFYFEDYYEFSCLYLFGRLYLDYFFIRIKISLNIFIYFLFIKKKYAAKNLGLEYLSAYMDSIGSSYYHGANFAAASSTIRRQNRTFFDGGSPFTLEIQVAQFIQFKTRTAKLYKQGCCSITSIDSENEYGK